MNLAEAYALLEFLNRVQKAFDFWWSKPFGDFEPYYVALGCTTIYALGLLFRCRCSRPLLYMSTFATLSASRMLRTHWMGGFSFLEYDLFVASIYLGHAFALLSSLSRPQESAEGFGTTNNPTTIVVQIEPSADFARILEKLLTHKRQDEREREREPPRLTIEPDEDATPIKRRSGLRKTFKA